ncbi:MAG: acetylglutamate kinase [Coriobacteriales bacterium]|jgi:acetylglutamate kinase|nr:acetylglutamate kinase [Coriobacteriales bacterium]
MEYVLETENARAARAEAIGQTRLLVESLPWIKEYTGKTVVIKYGGAAMTDARLRVNVMEDIVLMKIIGLNPIIVHGGGNDITRLCEQLGLPVEFRDGFRVTPPEVMEIVKMVLVGKVNQELVAELNQHGHIAVGLNGADGHIVMARQLNEEMGLVGSIAGIDTTLLVDLIESDYIPVIASVAIGADGQSYNVNADLVAGEIAAAIGAHKVIFLTDVDGLYRDFDDRNSLISRFKLADAKEMLASGTLTKGMIPKLQAVITALSAGVSRAHILNGTIAHAMLLEIFTNEGVGTMVLPDDQDYQPKDFENYPLDNLAAKLRG